MKDLEKEIENLNCSLKDFDGQEERLKEKNEESSKDIGNPREQVKSEKQKNEETYRRNNKIKTMFDEARIRLATKESERGMTKDKIPALSSSEGPSTFHVPFIPSLPTTDDPELARNPQWILEQWRKLKKSFENEEMVHKKKEMIERLLARSEELDEDVKNLVEYELQQLEYELHQFEAICKISR